MTILRIAYVIIVAFVLMPAQAKAVASDWRGDDAARVRLIAGVDAAGTQDKIPLGLEIKLGPEWHTYWRSPGMAGLPPQFDWKKSQTAEGNLKAATLLYPAPHRYTAYGLETVGYRDHVVLPIDAELRRAGSALVIDAGLDLLICSQLCVPKHFDLKLDIPAGEAKESAEAELVKEFRARVPGDTEKSGIRVVTVSTQGENLLIDIDAAHELEAPDIFIENDKNIQFGAPITILGADGHSAQFNLKPAEPLESPMAGLPVTLTVVDGTHALEQQTAVSAPAAASPAGIMPAHHVPSLTLVILFALIGGFILNLMPCVLPVLSLKVLSVVSHGGGETRVVRHSFLV
ncbi:MAG: protein-disulfide reductase DsbD domain-containing protein, partial [Bdellovibrionales bacterium]